MMHYSPYSSVEKYQKYANENREYWLKVFDENDIDVVLNGHDHAYTRTYIIKNGQPQVTDATSVTNPDGTLYLTFGSASGSQYHESHVCGSQVYSEQSSADVYAEYHRQQLQDDFVRCRYMGSTGSV